MTGPRAGLPPTHLRLRSRAQPGLDSVRRLCDHACVLAQTRSNPPQEDSAHDILAAEAFAMPAPDPRLRHGLLLPDDPAGNPRPHDILAAEEFAMPAPELAGMTDRARQAAAAGRRRWSAVAGAGGLLVLWLRRRRR